VIPEIKITKSRRILKPMVTSGRLSAIQTYIKQHISHHITIYVTNPEFQEISVVSRINFTDNIDTGFYMKQLQNEIQAFLSPWAFGNGSEITMGGFLYKSSIIEFIESKPYVNFILSISILVNGKILEENEITADEKTANVSAYYHRIIPVKTDAVTCQTDQGIDQMIVDINFDVQ
jgi:hypothetical protein